MEGRRSAKITISLPEDVLEWADSLAREQGSNRSAVIAKLLKKDEEERTRELMAEGYKAMGEENLRDAEESLGLTSEIILQDG